MSQDVSLKMTELDRLTSLPHMQLVKAALPYIHIPEQRFFSLFVKFRELEKTMQLFADPADGEIGICSVGERDKVVSLNDISIYTDEDDKPLMEVFEAIKAKENGEPVKFNPKKAPANELHEYFASVLPSYDRDRVFDNDLRKLFTWYNILVGNGITDFVDEEEKPAEPADAENGEQK